MDAHLIDSAIHGDNWSTLFSRDLFAERARLSRWLEVIIALAKAQGTLGLIPATSVEAISGIDAGELSIERIADSTRESSHSTLGLIREIQRHLPETAREHVYWGTTVQDITDTSAAMEMDAVGAEVWGGLHRIETTLMELATTYRSTPMIGRTHGQPGAPITFGFKAASWLDEVGRSIERLTAISHRVRTVQLGGAVGSLAFFGEDALALRQAFAAELGLTEPVMSWLTARDRLGEFGSTMAIATAALGRIANEVFTLQRAEIGELREASSAQTVGSITMPHKQNPEHSEQIVTLARQVRSQSSSIIENMIQEHERDARGWKSEWVTLPTLSHYTCAAVHLTQSLLVGLTVNSGAMLSNIHAADTSSSAQLLAHLTKSVGKHSAQAALHEVFSAVRSESLSVKDALLRAGFEVPDELLSNVDTGACAEMADRAVAAATARRADESTTWS